MDEELTSLVAKYAERPSAELWLELGHELWDSGYRETTSLTGLRRELKPDHYRGLAQRWLHAKRTKFHEAICLDFDYCGKKHQYGFDSMWKAIAAMATILAAKVNVSFAAAVIATVVLVTVVIYTRSSCRSALRCRH